MTSPLCPICGSRSMSMPEHPQAPLYRCRACGHAFSHAESIPDPEAYGASYFSGEHKRWFQYPNLRLFKRIARLLPNGGSVLDVGCGRGDFLRFLRGSRPDLRLTGLDLSPNDAGDGIQFLQGDVLLFDVGEQFDAVVTLAVIEHVGDVAGFVRRVRELTKPEGTIVVMTLDDGSLLYSLARAGQGLGVPLAFNRLYSKHHLHHFTASSLRALLQENGLQITAQWHHNAPLKAMDLPLTGRLTEAALRCGLWFLWGAGWVARRSYLQTVICTKVPGKPATLK